MLNMISRSPRMTQMPLPRFGLGACLPAPWLPPAPASKRRGCLRGDRPPPSPAPALQLALTVPVRPQRASAARAAAASDQQSAYNMTLTIADGAGDLGPHPAREPV